jgi:hypothetical protein
MFRPQTVDSVGVVKTLDDGRVRLKHLVRGNVKINIVALLTEYIVHERYINARGFLNTVFKTSFTGSPSVFGIKE